MFSDLESEFQCWQLIGIALNVVITKYAKQAKTKQNMVGFSQYYMGDNQWFYMVLFFTCICTLIVFLDKQVSLAPTLVRPSVRPSRGLEVILLHSVSVSEPSQSVETILWWPTCWLTWWPKYQYRKKVPVHVPEKIWVLSQSVAYMFKTKCIKPEMF